jgi:Phosphatase
MQVEGRVDVVVVVETGTAPSREELLAQLVADRVAGRVATPRANSLEHFRRLAEGDPHFLLGLDLDGRWPFSRVVDVMAERSGRPPESQDAYGPDFIDPHRTVAAVDRMAEVLRSAAERGSAVLVATGHPNGLLGIHAALARALPAAGARLVPVPSGLAAYGVTIDQFEGVAVIYSGGSLEHTHSPEWMARVLDALAASGRPLPDLVVADHGWAGCAAQRGVQTVCFADCNDPALFAAESEGTVAVTVPLDDGLPNSRYEPMIAYLLDRALGARG